MTPSSTTSTASPRRSPRGSPRRRSGRLRLAKSAPPPPAASSPRKVTTRSPDACDNSKKVKTPPPPVSKVEVEIEDEVEDDVDVLLGKKKPAPRFQDHVDLCDRMSKSFYYSGKLPTTPRPSLPLTKLAVSTFSKKARQDTLDFLDVHQAAEIGRNACVTPTAMIMAIVYLERLSVHNPTYLGSTKPSELFVISLMVASKFIQDDGEELGIFNDEWATSANIKLSKLNRMEIEFLKAIDWNLKVDPDEYGKAMTFLEKQVAHGEGSGRGWFTYSELSSLLPSGYLGTLWPLIYQHCVKTILLACLTYAALITTVITTSIVGPSVLSLTKTYVSNIAISTTTHRQLPIPISMRTYQTQEDSSLPSSNVLFEEDLDLLDSNDTSFGFQQDPYEDLMNHYISLPPSHNNEKSAKIDEGNTFNWEETMQVDTNYKYRNKDNRSRSTFQMLLPFVTSITGSISGGKVGLNPHISTTTTSSFRDFLSNSDLCRHKLVSLMAN